ncbi:MAG: aspartate aminotransferase family protein [Flavobacteriales bacterium]
MKTHNQNNFFKYQAQTTDFASAFEVSHAKGNYIYGKNGKAYLDFVAGVSANTLGHSYPAVIKAIKEQVDHYMHVMVYGEYVQDEPVALCKLLAESTPDFLETTYLTNSGTEAIEGALKLAKRYTGRDEIFAAKNAYHGNTQGAMSVMGNEEQKQAYRPLIPNVNFIEFNNQSDLKKITLKTAAVILETIQGAAGFIVPKNNYLQQVKKRCNEVGALLILDEIQPGFGRTGKLFAFQKYNVVPHIVVMGKGMGGGMPIGAFISSSQIMSCLKHQPALGHITTFGGHPVIAAAAHATLKELLNTSLMNQVEEKVAVFKSLLKHPKIKSIRGTGLMIAIELESKEYVAKVIQKCMEKRLIVFSLLFENQCLRITPPLTITKSEVRVGCKIILEVLDSM